MKGVYEVECPVCGAAPAVPCEDTRPNRQGWWSARPHAERIRAWDEEKAS